jgi:hypothetical protein
MSLKAAKWTTKYINDLPDSAFIYIKPGGKKDSEGKTTPRDLRYLPYKDDKGNIDEPHVNNAMARVTHTDLSDAVQKQCHDKILSIFKKLGKAHPKCSVPGCEGYEPKKSMLEDYAGFMALRGNLPPGWHYPF